MQTTEHTAAPGAAPLAFEGALTWRFDGESVALSSGPGPLSALVADLPGSPPLPELLARLAPSNPGALLRLVRAVLADGLPRTLHHRTAHDGAKSLRLATCVLAAPGVAGVIGATSVVAQPSSKIARRAAKLRREAAQLRESEREARRAVADLHVVLDTVADCISVQQPSGRLVFLNRAGQRALEPATLWQVGRRQWQSFMLSHYELWDEAGKPLQASDLPPLRALADRSPHRKLVRYGRKGSDHYTWALMRGVPILDDVGEPRMVVTAWTDVTEIQLAREELRRQKAVLQAVSEASLDAVLVVSPDGSMIYSDPKFARLWRIPEEALASGSDRVALESVRGQLRDPAAFMTRVEALYTTPDAEGHDELQLKDGRTIERYTSSIRGPEGQAYGRVWFFRDVSERNLARERERLLLEERVARASAERLLGTWQLLERVSQRLAAAQDVETMLRDVAGLVVGRLAKACIFDLLDEGGALRRVFAEAGTNDGLACALAAERVDLGVPEGLARALQERRTRDVEVLVHAGHSPLGERGSRAAELLNGLGARSLLVVPLVARGVPLGAMSLARGDHAEADVRLLAEQVGERLALAIEGAQLLRRSREAVALRDEFLSVASHELRTPLTAMRLAHQTLLRMAAQPGCISPQALSLARAADRHEQRLSRLIDALLDVTRIEARRLSLELETVDLAALTHEAVALAGPEAERAGSKIVLRPSGPVEGRWDRGRLEQVLSNLLSNAIKYGAGQPIEVEVRADAEWAELSVRDEGIGIPAERQRMVFERFERAVSSKHYAGLGLGLFIVRGIVNALGGEVRLKSEPGSGSTFTVRLPRSGPDEHAVGALHE